MSYTTNDYLLDRILIDDAVKAIWLAVDLSDWSRIPSLVHHRGMVLDYTAMFGGTPSNVTGEQVVGIWKPLMESLHSTQHVPIVASCDLPKPWMSAMDRPKTCTVIANAITTLIRKPDAEGEEQRNGARGEITLERASDDPNEKEWTISKIKITPLWLYGNPKLLAHESP